jgi:hypothetical protein
MADLIELLEHTRPGYEDELEYHRLLIDAYTGGGGFAGSIIQPPMGFWGAAAEVYSHARSTWQSEERLTYLDRYPREDAEKFKKRRQIAHYPNYIQPLTDLKTSFIMRKGLMVEDRPDALVEWREDIDGRGTAWDELLPGLVLRAATLGWFPAIIDMPPAPVTPEGTPTIMNRATADALGLRPTIIPLFPANLTDYQVDEKGRFVWAKIRTDHHEQLDPFSKATDVTLYTIWFTDRYEKYEVTKTATDGKRSARLIGEASHPFGEVPLAILPHKPMVDDPVKGIPMHGQESVEARRLFNLHSELDEHMRSQVFAVLVLAMGMDEAQRQVTIGTDNAIMLDPNATQSHYFIAPPPTVAQSYETRIEHSIQEIYRQARVEFTRPSASRQAVSGIARKFEFAQTDRALAVFAQQIARFEEHVDWLVGAAFNVSPEQLELQRITAPDSFDVEDLQTDLQLAVDAITQLTVGPTAETRLRARVINQLLPNLNDEDKDQIAEELENVQNTQQQEQQINEEIAAALTEDEDEEPQQEVAPEPEA